MLGHEALNWFGDGFRLVKVSESAQVSGSSRPDCSLPELSKSVAFLIRRLTN